MKKGGHCNIRINKVGKSQDKTWKWKWNWNRLKSQSVNKKKRYHNLIYHKKKPIFHEIIFITIIFTNLELCSFGIFMH